LGPVLTTGLNADLARLYDSAISYYAAMQRALAWKKNM
jgi:hypothetical protein